MTSSNLLRVVYIERPSVINNKKSMMTYKQYMYYHIMLHISKNWQLLAAWIYKARPLSIASSVSGNNWSPHNYQDISMQRSTSIVTTNIFA